MPSGRLPKPTNATIIALAMSGASNAAISEEVGGRTLKAVAGVKHRARCRTGDTEQQVRAARVSPPAAGIEMDGGGRIGGHRRVAGGPEGAR